MYSTILAAVDGSRPQLRCDADSNEFYVGNPDKSKDGTKIRVDKIERRVRTPRVIHYTRRHQNGGFLARKQSLRSFRSVSKSASSADDLVDPQLEHRGNAEVMHGHANHVLVCLFQFGDGLIRVGK